MALYVLFENKNTFLFLYFICLLLKWDQIIFPDPIYIYIYIYIIYIYIYIYIYKNVCGYTDFEFV